MTSTTIITQTYNDKQLKFKQTCDDNNECKIQSCGADIKIEYKECDDDICNNVKCFKDSCDVYSNIIPEVEEITCEEESNESEYESNEDESEEESNEDEGEDESNEDEGEDKSNEDENEETTNNSYMKYIFNKYTLIMFILILGLLYLKSKKKSNQVRINQ